MSGDVNLGQVVRESYWEICRGLVRDGNKDDLAFVVDRLLQVRRPFTAAHILQMAMRSNQVEAETLYRVLEAGLSGERNQEPVGRFDAHATQELIKHLQENSVDQLHRLARIEWGYLRVLGRRSSATEPSTLIRELQTSPSLFVDVVKLVYRGAHEEPREQPLTDAEKNQWRHANDLLDAFSEVPGTNAEGVIDESYLSEWTTQVRSLAQQEDRLAVADIQLGQIFSRCPRREGIDWPPRSTCHVIEAIGSDEMLRGFTNGLISGRGITSRALTAGGQPEREMAASYRELAAELQIQFPRLANALHGLAEHYDRAAEGEDVEAERERLER